MAARIHARNARRAPRSRARRAGNAARGGASAACPLGDSHDGVPACDTGPAGRARFVIDELRQIWRQRRQKDGR